jgi:hypothetical protein
MAEFNRDSGKIKNFERTPEGYLKAWIPVGVADKILNYGDRKEIINLDSLTNEKTTNSLVGKPITLNHPPAAINSTNHRKYAVGTFLQEHNTDNNVVYHAAIITDEDVANKVETGELKYVSSGYFSDKKPNTDGTIQQLNRSYNHGSILTPENQPRAGEMSKIFLQTDSLDLTELNLSDAAPQIDSEVVENKSNLQGLTESDSLSCDATSSLETESITETTKSNTNKRPKTENKTVTTESKTGTIKDEKTMKVDAKEIASRVELISEWKQLLTEEGVSINYDSSTAEIKKQILSCYYPKELLSGLNLDSIDGFWVGFVTEYYEKREGERREKRQINQDSKNSPNCDAKSLREEYVRIISG